MGAYASCAALRLFTETRESAANHQRRTGDCISPSDVATLDATTHVKRKQANSRVDELNAVKRRANCFAEGGYCALCEVEWMSFAGFGLSAKN
jgi:hypothetical protein